MTTTKHRPKKPREITRKGKQDRTAPHLERSQPAEKRQRSGQGRARRSPRGQDDDGNAGSPLRPRDWATARAGSSSADAAVTPLGCRVAPAASVAGSAGGRPGREARGGRGTNLIPAARSREISREPDHARSPGLLGMRGNSRMSGICVLGRGISKGPGWSARVLAHVTREVKL